MRRMHAAIVVSGMRQIHVGRESSAGERACCAALW
jgi:hypothetical protein